MEKGQQISYKALLKAFRINGDEELLLKKIEQGDKASLVQLSMLYIPTIISFTEHWVHSWVNNNTNTEYFDITLNAFIQFAEHYNGTNSQFYDELSKYLKETVKQTLKGENKINCYERPDLDSFQNIAYLNKLNAFLTTKEHQIVARVTEYLEMIQLKINNKDVFTTAYELMLEVYYMPPEEDCDAMHIYMDCFNLLK